MSASKAFFKQKQTKNLTEKRRNRHQSDYKIIKFRFKNSHQFSSGADLLLYCGYIIFAFWTRVKNKSVQVKRITLDALAFIFFCLFRSIGFLFAFNLSYRFQIGFKYNGKTELWIAPPSFFFGNRHFSIITHFASLVINDMYFFVFCLLFRSAQEKIELQLFRLII